MVNRENKLVVSSNLRIRVYKTLFIFVVDGKAFTMLSTENLAGQIILNIAHLLPKRPKKELQTTWKFQAWVHDSYEEFCVEQIDYSNIRIFRQSYTKEIIEEATCYANLFYKELIVAANYFIQRSSENSSLLPENHQYLNIQALKDSVSKIRLYYDDFYG